jgi:hypothetical protein
MGRCKKNGKTVFIGSFKAGDAWKFFFGSAEKRETKKVEPSQETEVCIRSAGSGKLHKKNR